MDAFLQWLSTSTLVATTVVVTVSILLIGVVVIYVTAFFQGRAVHFLPPSIGEKPLATSNARNLKEKGEESKISLDLVSISRLGIKEFYSGRQETSLPEIHARVRAAKWAFIADNWFGAIRFEGARRVLTDFVKEGKSIQILITYTSPYQDKLKSFIEELDPASKTKIDVRLVDRIPKGIYGTDVGAYVTFHCEHIVLSEAFTVYCVPTDSPNSVYAQVLGEFQFLWKKATAL